MTGNALMDFLIAIVGLCLIAYLLVLAVDRFAPDAFFAKVAKVVVGGLALIMLLVALKAVFFGGGGAISVSPNGVIAFAIGLLVVALVLYLVYLAIDYLVAEEWQNTLKYIIGAIALIALLVLAQQVLFGGGFLDDRKRAGQQPFWTQYKAVASASPPRPHLFVRIVDLG